VAACGGAGAPNPWNAFDPLHDWTIYSVSGDAGALQYYWIIWICIHYELGLGFFKLWQCFSFLHGGDVLSVRAGCRTFHPSLFAEVPWQRGHWCGFCFVLVGLVCAVFVCCFIPLPGSENLILFSACCNIAASQQTV